MMKRFLTLVTVLLVSVLCHSQANFTTVTATLTDSNTQVWSTALVIASLRPAPGIPSAPLNNGLPILDSPQAVFTDGTGTFTLILDDTSHITPAGATWQFNIYPNASVANASSITLGIVGNILNLTGALSSILIPPAVNAQPVINRAYSQTEVNGGIGAIYWDVTANAIKGCQTFVNGLCTSWITIGNIAVPGLANYIPFNNGSGGFTASANLQFNPGTNTFTTVNGVFSLVTSPVYQSITANNATAGVYRLASTDTQCWRNNANSANLCWSKNTSDQFTAPGVLLSTSLTTPTLTNPTSTGSDNGAETLVNKILTSPTINTPTITSPTTTGTDGGTETLTNKTLTSPIINVNASGTGVQGTDTKLLSALIGFPSVGQVLCMDAQGGATNTGCLPTPSFNTTNKVTLSSPVSLVNNTQATVLTEAITAPSATGNYKIQISYNVWVTAGGNLCVADVVDSLNSRVWAASGQNANGTGFIGIAGSELSPQTYVQGANVTLNLNVICNNGAGGLVGATVNANGNAIFTPTPQEPSYLSATFVATN